LIAAIKELRKGEYGKKYKHRKHSSML
jgi:hypothetical protein